MDFVLLLVLLNTLSHELILHVKRSCEDSAPLEGNRIIWCPHIDDDDDDENVSEQILAVTCGNVAEVLHIAMITETYGNAVDLKCIKKGFVRIANGHTQVSRIKSKHDSVRFYLEIEIE